VRFLALNVLLQPDVLIAVQLQDQGVFQRLVLRLLHNSVERLEEHFLHPVLQDLNVLILMVIVLDVIPSLDACFVVDYFYVMPNAWDQLQ